jgi:hypothetical protein
MLNAVQVVQGNALQALPPKDAGPKRLLDLARAHWAIENKLHYVRDVALNEDRCRVRSGARPLVAFRNLTLFMIRSLGLNVPEARENFREDRAEAILDSLNDPGFFDRRRTSFAMQVPRL